MKSIKFFGKVVLFLAVGLSARGEVNSGGWVSGGGELIRDGRNPWFLANVSDVNYCIDIDEENFGQSRERAALIIAKALENWKAEFKNGIVNSESLPLGIATQNFHERSCASPGIDIAFQLGKLGRKQRLALDEPGRYAAITVRTDYDRVKMRGRGFIYVSPERGLLRMKAENIVANPWGLENGGLLYLAILHELGHVFGLPHASGRFDLMNERRVENALDLKMASTEAGYWRGFPQPFVFKFASDVGMTLMTCGLPQTKSDGSSIAIKSEGIVLKASLSNGIAQPVVNLFFGVPPEFKCTGYSFGNGSYTVFGGKGGPGNEAVTIGKAQLSRFDSSLDQEVIINVWLPKEQKAVPGAGERMVSGPMRQAITRFKGVYVSSDGKISREMFLLIGPGLRETIGGVMDGKIYSDLHIGF